MIRPNASQTKKWIQVLTVRPAINPVQRTTDISGKSGENGTRNPRGRLGSRLRKKITPRETRTKAKRVPMFDKSAASPISTNPAGIPTANPAIQVDQWGV